MTMPNPPGRQTVAPGELIASDWGNAVWDQSVVRFTDATQRDTQWPAPPDGAWCYLQSTGGYMIYFGGGWHRTALEIYPANVLAGAESGTSNRMWLSVSTQVVTTNAGGNFALSFHQDGPALYTVLVMAADDSSPGAVAGTFDYHPNYCQGTYARNGVLVTDSGVRLNVIAIMGT